MRAAAISVGQDAPCPVHVAHRGGRGRSGIGVMPLGEAPIGSRDDGAACIPRDSEDGVRIALGPIHDRASVRHPDRQRYRS
jgi:hypothetical protein